MEVHANTPDGELLQPAKSVFELQISPKEAWDSIKSLSFSEIYYDVEIESEHDQTGNLTQATVLWVGDDVDTPWSCAGEVVRKQGSLALEAWSRKKLEEGQRLLGESIKIKFTMTKGDF